MHTKTKPIILFITIIIIIISGACGDANQGYTGYLYDTIKLDYLPQKIYQNLIIDTNEKSLPYKVRLFSSLSHDTRNKIKKIYRDKTIIEIGAFNNNGYIDYLDKDDSVRTIITFYQSGSILKCVCILNTKNNMVEEFSNLNNEIFEFRKQEEVQQFHTINPERNLPVLDPFYCIPNTLNEYTDKTIADVPIDQNTMTVKETVNLLDKSVISYDYLENIALPEMAGLYRSLLSDVMRWDGLNRQDCKDFESYYIINSTNTNFYYNKSVYLNKKQTQNEPLYVSDGYGNFRHSLDYQSLLQSSGSLLNFFVYDRPQAMVLCNDYYIDIGYKLIKRIGDG